VSETAPERSGSNNVWAKKYGPLPLWGWAAIVLGVLWLYSKYKSKNSSGANAQSASTVDQPGGVDSSLVPQFVNQVYDNDVPPSAPNITVNNTVPTPPINPGGPPHWKPPTPSPEPTTISGSPGSYTTGLPGGMNEWTSNGKYSLNVIAKSHGMTAQQLIKASEAAENNVALKAYVSKGNFNAPVPAGVQLFIPNANWKVRK
jgi:hypothetical protein